jgi:hypothetical protein
MLDHDQLENAKKQLDIVINNSRVHLYKPIQIAEILYRERMHGDIDISRLETYRTKSKAWRDDICRRFLDRTSTSSSRYQDNVFEKNATPPEVLKILSTENIKKNGIVEAYIYKCFQRKQFQMIGALQYANNTHYKDFRLLNFLELFRSEPGLKRSLDKILEIVVYSLFVTVIRELDATINVSVPSSKMPLLIEFEELTSSLMGISPEVLFQESPASVNRVGVTNAADRGLDMWANFGPAIQIKHLPLTEKLAGEIVGSANADKIVIVCKKADSAVIGKILGHLGLKQKIQSIITEEHLTSWYEKALRGGHSDSIGPRLLTTIRNEIVAEFPTSHQDDFMDFLAARNYDSLKDDFWRVS